MPRSEDERDGMRGLIHKLAMRLIPHMPNWKWTRRMMRINFWANEREFAELAEGENDD